MSESRYGRFTARGDDIIERQIEMFVDEVRAVIAAHLPARHRRAVVLMGGYGRGEGGVDMSTGVPRPHNNLDILLITRGWRERAREQARQHMQSALAPLAERHGIAIDLGAIDEGKLRRSRCLVMWYDMRYGHKTLLGDADFLPRLRQFSQQHIDPADVHNLLVNRGTLLVINRLMLAGGELDEGERRAVIKHAMKAIIGYGDALLFARGRYHWSYKTKQQRMRALAEVPEAVRLSYDDAIEFRFSPDYARYQGRDLLAWNRALTEQLAPIHLAFERWRLGNGDLTWPAYVGHYFRHQLLGGISGGFSGGFKGARASARTLAKHLWHARTKPPPIAAFDPVGSWADNLPAGVGYRASSASERLSAAFPAVAYASSTAQERSVASVLVGAPVPYGVSNTIALDCAYLRAWGRFRDINFAQVSQKLSLALEPDGAGAGASAGASAEPEVAA